MLILSIVIVVISSIWVYVDARRLAKNEEGANESSGTGPGGWFLFCLVLWILGFPLYLLQRGRYKFNGKAGNPAMVRAVGFTLAAFLVLIIVLSFTGDIKMSTTDLQGQVRKSMKETLAKNAFYREAQVKDVSLIHKSGNEYEGLAILTVGGVDIPQRVEVIYDGKQFVWQLK